MDMVTHAYVHAELSTRGQDGSQQHRSALTQRARSGETSSCKQAQGKNKI